MAMSVLWGEMEMRRRVFIVMALAAAVLPALNGVASATAVTRLLITGPFGKPSAAYTVKGTLYFRVTGDKSDRTLNTYWNGSVYDPARQCPELIKRYARLLGFAGYGGVAISGDNGNKLPSLGNGDAVASRFATASKKGFTYYANGSAVLPKPGSVISISGRSRADNVVRIDGGHVGILGDYPAPGTKTTVTAKLFDQNMPIALWKDVRFEKRNGKWYGLWTNSSRDHDVIGWATPSG
jgi:hypothetical protein